MISIKSLKKRLLNYLLKDCFGAINESDIIEISKSGQGYKIKIGGQAIDRQILMLIANQARQFQNTELWKILTTTLRAKGMELTSSKATEYEQVWGGKLLQYAIKFQEEIIETLKKL